MIIIIAITDATPSSPKDGGNEEPPEDPSTSRARTQGGTLTCLVREQVGDPPQLLGDRAGADHRPRDF